MIANLCAAVQIAYRCKGYRPKAVTVGRTIEWFRQFPKDQHAALRCIARSIQFINEQQLIEDLRDLNRRLLRKLEEGGVKPENVIYASFHDAGSSSAAVLNLVRDACGLEKLGCKFIHASAQALHDTTAKLAVGAIVYIDDFIGSGKQFCAVREFLAQYIVGNFSEFLLAHTICEEGISELARRNSVEPMPAKIHGRTERPLHEYCAILPDKVKDDLRRYCRALSREYGLGFHGLATMVVYYRNAPNTVPLLLRGARNQTLCRGIVPRTTDLDVV